MKIKEICEKTGLTDRTVRYYIEEQLIAPSYTENYLGRKSFDFSEQDLERLKSIATLRTFGFSVEEIRELSLEEGNSRQIVEAVKRRAEECLDESNRRLSVLSVPDLSDAADLSDLAQKLSELNLVIENENTGANRKKRFLSLLGACVIFLAVWLPIVSAVGVFVFRFSTLHAPILRPAFLAGTLLCFLPSAVVLVLRKIKGAGKNLRFLLISLCVCCIPLGVILSSKSVLACSHSYETYRTVVEASCERAGETVMRCEVCGGFETERVEQLAHAYSEKNAAPAYIRTEATVSEAATYYYSCKCGRCGTAYFSHGSKIPDSSSGPSGWSACDQTVYGIAEAYFYVKPESQTVCGVSGVGYPIKVVSTDGKWYEVDQSNPYTNGTAYIQCSHVTDDPSLAAFVRVPEDFSTDAVVKNVDKGAYLRSDISGSDSGKVGLIKGSGHLTIAAMNESKSWVAVYYYGEDSEGRWYDASKLYYCSVSELVILGLPEDWPSVS